MSDTDSFIDEVTEEVRRDRLYALLRRYGWIAVLVIILIVAGAAYSEYRKAQVKSQAQAFGDDILAALDMGDGTARADALRAIEAKTPRSEVITQFLAATADANADNSAEGVAALEAIVTTPDLPPIYTAIASFKALTLQSDTMDAASRRQGFEALAQPGAPLRLLAEEQLALIDVQEGNVEAALDRLQSIRLDAETGAALQQRITRLILALGADPAERPDVDQG